MAISKKVREQVFGKFGGHCAYCGCELQKGWHVDHVDPCRRLREWYPGGWYHKSTGEPATMEETNIEEQTKFLDFFVWKDARWVECGFANPEANHIDNYFPACPSCNINKHGDTIEQFRASIAGYLRSLNLRMVQYKMVKKYGLVEETEKPVIFYFETAHNAPSV